MSNPKHPDPAVANAITTLESNGRKVQIVGSIKNGKIELDPTDLADLAAKHPNLVFLAMNSPFDPVSVTP